MLIHETLASYVAAKRAGTLGPKEDRWILMGTGRRVLVEASDPLGPFYEEMLVALEGAKDWATGFISGPWPTREAALAERARIEAEAS